jgi:hypothetical protein
MHASLRGLALCAAATSLFAVTACSDAASHATGRLSAAPAPVAAPVNLSANVAPRAIITIRPTLPPPTIRPTLRLLPDLTIGLDSTHTCTWSTDVDGEVWVNPLIELRGTGFNIPPSASFNMMSNYYPAGAGGLLSVNVPQTWAIDIGPSANLPALGHVLVLTLTADPTHEVTESNESNNTGTITINLTGVSSPPGGSDTPIACS